MAEEPDYERMSVARVEELAAQGDEGAQRAIAGHAGKLMPLIEEIANMPNPLAEWAAEDERNRAERRRQMAELERQTRELAEERERREQAAIQREQQMLTEMAEMRKLAQRGEERERRNHLYTVAGLTFGALGVIAAVVAIFAAG